jgi:DNA-binding NtrC family response regulator
MTTDISALRVLIVDDDPLFCWSFAETLSAYGDVVTIAETGAQAIRAVAAAPHEVDVVLLDYQLPDSRGLGILSALKQVAPECPVVLISAFCTPELGRDATTLGACRVVSKPIDMGDVPALVHLAAGLRPH